MLTLPPLSLYIHYPWCIKKCPYCDFNSYQTNTQHQNLSENYIACLMNDLEQDLEYVNKRKIKSIFIGGGTPSLMKKEELAYLLQSLSARLHFDKKIEITLEANPAENSLEKLRAFFKSGVNRLSIGVQSFDNKTLKALGRVHLKNTALKAVYAAKIAGFDNINIDLMYGISPQNLACVINDIKTAIHLAPSHISFYELNIEVNTLFAKFLPKMPDDEQIWKMTKAGDTLLKSKNYIHYEISAYGKIPSKHNLNYWHFGDYLGIGAGAHGKITDIHRQKIIRTSKAKSPKDYMQDPNKKRRIVTNTSFEFMLGALRLKNGFPVKLFETRTGETISNIKDKLYQGQVLDLLEIHTNFIKPTPKGWRFLNDLQMLFL